MLKENNVVISIIMPSYNSSQNIVEAIESFLDQNYPNKELVIVDGKSTDESHKIIASYSEQHSNIKWVKDYDSCVTDAINIGVRNASGQWIGFLMTDDRFCYPDFLIDSNRLIALMNFDLLYSNTYYYYTIDGEKQVFYYKPENKLNRADMLTKGSSVAIIDSMLVKKKVLQEFPLDPQYNLSSDYEFIMRISNGKLLFFYLDKFTTCCNYSGTNLSSRNLNVQMQQFSKVSIKFLDENLSKEQYLLFHKIVFEKGILNKEEFGQALNLFQILLQANLKIKFYPQSFFESYIAGHWFRINSQLYKGIKLKFYLFLTSGYIRSDLKRSRHKIVIFKYINRFIR